MITCQVADGSIDRTNRHDRRPITRAPRKWLRTCIGHQPSIIYHRAGRSRAPACRTKPIPARRAKPIPARRKKPRIASYRPAITIYVDWIPVGRSALAEPVASESGCPLSPAARDVQSLGGERVEPIHDLRRKLTRALALMKPPRSRTLPLVSISIRVGTSRTL